MMGVTEIRCWERSADISKMLVFGRNIQGIECAEEAGIHERSKKVSAKLQAYLANVGIEPKTFALLARRSNQLS